MSEKILALITEINPYVEIDLKTNLIEEGVLDSMAILLLVSELEEEFTIKIPYEDLKLEDFAFIDNIAEMIKTYY